jgi:hypothetical protein
MPPNATNHPDARVAASFNNSAAGNAVGRLAVCKVKRFGDRMALHGVGCFICGADFDYFRFDTLSEDADSEVAGLLVALQWLPARHLGHVGIARFTRATSSFLISFCRETAPPNVQGRTKQTSMTPRHISWALTIVGIGAFACWWLLATSEYVMLIGKV